MKLSVSTLYLASAIAVYHAVATSPDGKQASKPKRELFSTRIVGGTQANQGDYPFFVEWDNGSCGASLVWKDVLLTAAHCDAITSNDVLVGAYQSWQVTTGAVPRTITKRIIHPNYNSNTMNYDFLVMKLDSPVSNAPITLNANANYPVSNQPLTVIGFGVTSSNGQEPPTLRQVTVPYVDTQTCSNEIGDTLNPTLELCAGISGKDSCQGDSGGPLMDANNVQVGIVSYGYGCGVAGSPGVYSRVSGAIDWINQQICLLSSNPPPSCNGGTAPVKSPVKAPISTPVQVPVTSPTTQTPPPTISGAPFGNTPSPSPGATPAGSTPNPTTSGGNTPSPTISPTDQPTPSPPPTKKPSLRPTFKPIAGTSSIPATKPTIKPVGGTSHTPAPAGTTIIRTPAGFCFSEANTVTVEGKGSIAIKDLRIGDKVMGSDGAMTTVYSFGHYKQQTKAEYLQIHTSGLAKPLELSKDHLLFVNGVAVPASTMSVGDKLDTIHGRSSAEIKKIRFITRQAAYAPFTTSGTIMVSGIAASSFVTLQDNSSVLVAGQLQTSLSWQWLAHVFETPHRLVCMWSMDYCKAETYSDEGISKWVEVPLHVSQWLIQQNVVVMMLLFSPALMLWSVLSVVEMSFHNSWVLAMIALLAFLYQKGSSKPSKCKSD